MNPRHAVLETAALPTELYPYVLALVYYTHSRAVCKGVFQKKFHDRKKPFICTPLPLPCRYNPPPPFGQSRQSGADFGRLCRPKSIQWLGGPHQNEVFILTVTFAAGQNGGADFGRLCRPKSIQWLGGPHQNEVFMGMPAPARKPCKADSTLLSFSYEIISIKRSQNYEHRMVG